ncbi:hypothetical protein [Methermicoccus shengliensis]|uniref:Uncharacterized protein n=1 Tax=Methermicoccus shengliensis TaxID=660064 RepID=A0A832VXI0_9EURY|nr:hypothetical protein [Methermicoccus shengliensis]KUK04145.1 MAG: hypothetical protein XD46_1128 [Euryarchaeota archaeon 55_53]KUK29741.1 MAG: hypothetical protein XD62_1194 [Methanosarcinales archeaon 56_1174]MDI3487791.1 hypothetical protein [Methanosarcinales archaeon]MDN5294852.1 hypothetical protein [Methanosarcinales archaeon]HIH69872.1 hypothetical protein [Methermicoccus shengliensis]
MLCAEGKTLTRIEEAVRRLTPNRVGSILELDPYRIGELKKNEECTYISHLYFNKGVYRVLNRRTKEVEPFVVEVVKVEAATYDELVSEVGERLVDIELWRPVGRGEPIFFYLLKRMDVKG